MVGHRRVGVWTRLDRSRCRKGTLGRLRVGVAGRAIQSGSTYREIYEVQLRLHILPHLTATVPALGEQRLDRITPELVRRWYATLAETHSRSVAAKAYTRLRQILSQAVDDERLARNPCRIDGGGVEDHPEQRFITIKQLYQLADVVPDRYRALVLAAGLGGTREGELFALRRADIDLANGVVRVRRKRVRLASGDVIEGAPKSRAGRRDVALPAPVVEELRAHLDTYTGPDPDDYVFTSTRSTPLERSNFRYRVWIPATEAVGLVGLRFHDLRHTAGTLAAQTGATTNELMARLGHSSTRAAMIYQHAWGTTTRISPTGSAPRNQERPCEQGLSGVVGTGVDPVTSRFSGARSTN